MKNRVALVLRLEPQQMPTHLRRFGEIARMPFKTVKYGEGRVWSLVNHAVNGIQTRLPMPMVVAGSHYKGTCKTTFFMFSIIIA